MKSLMKTRKQKETGEKEVHLLEQKGYERMVNEIVPVQQAEAYRKPTNKAVKEAVKELNPDTNSLGISNSSTTQTNHCIKGFGRLSVIFI